MGKKSFIWIEIISWSKLRGDNTNKQRRQKINKIRQEIEKCKNDLESILDEERDCFDNMSENLQGSMRGYDSEEAIDVLESCIDELCDVVEELLVFI